MHITIIADTIDNQSAGVYTYTKNIIKNIPKDIYFSFIHEKQNPFFKKLKKTHPNTKDFIIPKKNIPFYNSYRKFFLIPKLFKKLNPDIIFEPCHIGPFNTPKKSKKVVMIHDLTPILFPKFHIKKSTIVHQILLKKVLKQADLILTASERTKKDILKYSKTNSKITIIPLGISHPNKKEKPTPVKQNPYFLYLGTIEPRKNISLLIDAFLELKKEHKITHKLILTGKIGWKSKKIIKKAKISPEIILTNYINEKEKHNLYKNADIFIYPSIYEGFGLPPLEAMSYKIPVITSTGGSLKEIYGNYALQFDPQDKTKLKNHIISILNNPKKQNKLTQKAKTFSQNFSWEKTAKKTFKELEKL